MSLTRFWELRKKCPLFGYCAAFGSLFIVFCLSMYHVRMLIADSPAILGMRGTCTAIAFFAVVFLMFLGSFLVTTSVQSPPIPAAFSLEPAELEAIAEVAKTSQKNVAPEGGNPEELEAAEARAIENLRKLLENAAKRCPVHMRDENGLFANCAKCKILRPDRCHHCRRCKRCIIRQDHHCEFFNNCVHLKNYKAFVCTLFYGAALCTLIVSLTLIVEPWKFHRSNVWTYIILWFCGLGGFALILFLCYHCCIACRGRTHKEVLLGNGTPHEDFFSTGSKWKNLQVSLGPWYWWWWPVSRIEPNGIICPVKAEYRTGDTFILENPGNAPQILKSSGWKKRNVSVERFERSAGRNIFAACLPPAMPPRKA